MSLTILNKQSNKEISQRKMETYEKYCEIIGWGRSYPVEFASRFMGIELLDIQKYAIYNAWFRDFIIWLESRNAGKALALDTNIPTPNGNTTMRDLMVGDYVYDENGNPIKVIAISNIFKNHKCYEIKFEDGETIISDENHLWYVQTKNFRKVLHNNPKTNRKRVNFNSLDEDGFKVLKTSEMVNDYFLKRKDNKGVEYKYRVPKSAPIKYQEQNLLIPPYVLGVWLGDGNCRDARVTSHIDDCNEIAQYIKNEGYYVNINKVTKTVNSIGIGINSNTNLIFRKELKQYNLIQNKHIPEQYLYSSINQRYELLQGLMDTDGTCDTLGRCEFAQKSLDFIQQFSQLLTSLSIKHKVTKRNTKCNGKEFESYRVYFCVDKTNSCFKLLRKHNRLKDNLSNRSNNKSIISIKEVPSVPTKCIRVDSKKELFLCGNYNTVTHNSTQLAIYTMLRSLLIPFHTTYFLGNTGDQAKETYKKIEKIAKKEIESFTGCTDVFLSELVKNGATSDGFVHNPASFTFKLFNGAEVNTLNSDITNIKGKRANLVCFDEAGWFSDELFIQAENFVNQDENFKLGGNIDIALEPKGFPRQLMYASSASDTSSEFYKKFKNFSCQMLMGNQKYFACNFTIDLVMSAKFNGEEYPPLISKDKVDKAMNDNREKALRELYNKFSADSHDGQILTRRDLLQHTVNRPPLLTNDTGNRLVALSWDSARLNDNSTIGAAEFRLDDEKGWCMDLHNVINLVDISSKKKTPMIMPKQVEKFKEILLDYNASDKQKLDYENIKAIICDSGAGGQMVGGISDYLLEDWHDKSGTKHKGLIDKSHKANETSKNTYLDAVDIVKLVDPKGNRNAIFESIEKMVKLGVVTFPAEYNDKDYLSFIEDNGEEIRYDLSEDEKISLIQIELLKTEIITMCKYESNGNITYNYPPDKRTMHDDRVFMFGLLCFYLAQLRRGQIINKSQQTDYSSAPRCISKADF